jgi:CubicO group peptidase (beta-lactamase class C family)
MSNFQSIAELIEQEMARRNIPGVAIGILYGDEEHVAGFGVTNIEHPLPVDGDTLFQVGSITKTVTATLAMRLVEEGRLALDAPVRTYLPGLRMADEEVAARVTVRHLFTHTGGWAGDYFDDLGRGDDALAKIVERLANLTQITPLGRYWSYNNAGLYLAGRVLEVVGGMPYERLTQEMLLAPLGMDRSFFFAEQCITHRVGVGHEAVYDDNSREPPKVARPWALPRAAGPAGGLVSTVRDQLTYASFHMAGGLTRDGTQLLAAESIAHMQAPRVRAANDESVGLAWFIRDLPGARIIRHTGGTNGQQTALQMVPARRYACTVLTNSDRGSELHQLVQRLALKLWLDVAVEDPEPVPVEPGQLTEYEGCYRAPLQDLIVRVESEALLVERVPKGGFPTPDSPPSPPIPPMRALMCGPDKLIGVEEPGKGLQAEFLREDGVVTWLRMNGRMHRRIQP